MLVYELVCINVSHNKWIEIILLTVRSGSLLTWLLNRRWDNSKQGKSKSYPPPTRCSFGKLYSGKWLFLRCVLCLFFPPDHHHLYCIWSLKSPVALNHLDNHWSAGLLMSLTRSIEKMKQQALQRRVILFGHVCVSHCGGLDRADSIHSSCVIEASCIGSASVSMHPLYYFES